MCVRGGSIATFFPPLHRARGSGSRAELAWEAACGRPHSQTPKAQASSRKTGVLPGRGACGYSQGTPSAQADERTMAWLAPLGRHLAFAQWHLAAGSVGSAWPPGHLTRVCFLIWLTMLGGSREPGISFRLILSLASAGCTELHGKKLGPWVRASAPAIATLEAMGLLECQPLSSVRGCSYWPCLVFARIR